MWRHIKNPCNFLSLGFPVFGYIRCLSAPIGIQSERKVSYTPPAKKQRCRLSSSAHVRIVQPECDKPAHLYQPSPSIPNPSQVQVRLGPGWFSSLCSWRHLLLFLVACILLFFWLFVLWRWKMCSTPCFPHLSDSTNRCESSTRKEWDRVWTPRWTTRPHLCERDKKEGVAHHRPEFLVLFSFVPLLLLLLLLLFLLFPLHHYHHYFRYC